MYSKELDNILLRCLSFDPSRRPSAIQIGMLVVKDTTRGAHEEANFEATIAQRARISKVEREWKEQEKEDSKTKAKEKNDKGKGEQFKRPEVKKEAVGRAESEKKDEEEEDKARKKELERVGSENKVPEMEVLERKSEALAEELQSKEDAERIELERKDMAEAKRLAKIWKEVEKTETYYEPNTIGRVAIGAMLVFFTHPFPLSLYFILYTLL